jgi:3-phenylpropionate/trans-cinnamate dioxygenase ferredoxin component
MSWHLIGDTAGFEIDQPVSIDVDGEPVLVVKTIEGFFAVSDVCSHAEVSLAEGTVSDGQIECWLHGAQFDLATGSVLCLPATRPIETYSVRVGNSESKTAVEVSLIKQEQE